MKLIFLILMTVPLFAAAALEVKNPCEDRKFCQRVVLVLTGAGKDEVVPGPLGLDRFGHSALDDVKILSKGGDNQNAPKTYVFSGYPELSKAVNDLKLPGVKTFDSNKDDWNSFVNSLPKDLEGLLEDPRCKSMVEKELKPSMSADEKLAVLSKYISVEVSLYGHSVKLDAPEASTGQKYGMSFGVKGQQIASSAEQTAKFAQMSQANSSSNPYAFDASNFASLKNKLKNATFRGLTQACNGTEVAKFLEPSNDTECACFVSGSDATTVAMSWPDKSPLGLHFENSKSKANSPDTLSSLSLVKDALYDPYVASPSSKKPGAYLPSGISSSSLKNRNYGDMSYGDSTYALYDTIDYMSLPVNPLSGLVKSSADLAAASALQVLAKGGDLDAILARDLSAATSLSEIQSVLTKTKDPQNMAFLKEVLQKATNKAERVISPVSRVTAEIAKGNTDYGAYRLAQLFAPDSKFEGVNAADKAFVKTLKDAKAHYAGTKNEALVNEYFQGFYELFDTTSENFIGNITKYGPKADSKLVVYWSRIDGMKSVLNNYYRNQLRSGKIGIDEYEQLIKSLEASMTVLSDTVNGYVAGRAEHLKKDAFIVNEVKVAMGLKLLAKRVKESESGKRSASIDEVKAYSRLLAQVDCLEAYGYGPSTFTPEGDTLIRSHSELGVR